PSSFIHRMRAASPRPWPTSPARRWSTASRPVRSSTRSRPHPPAAAGRPATRTLRAAGRLASPPPAAARRSPFPDADRSHASARRVPPLLLADRYHPPRVTTASESAMALPLAARPDHGSVRTFRTRVAGWAAEVPLPLAVAVLCFAFFSPAL